MQLSGTGRQIYTTLCSNLLSMAYGASIGWASNALPFLQSNSVLSNRPLTKEGQYFQSTYIHTYVDCLLDTDS